jgi:hypothetical protein
VGWSALIHTDGSTTDEEQAESPRAQWAPYGFVRGACRKRELHRYCSPERPAGRSSSLPIEVTGYRSQNGAPVRPWASRCLLQSRHALIRSRSSRKWRRPLLTEQSHHPHSPLGPPLRLPSPCHLPSQRSAMHEEAGIATESPARSGRRRQWRSRAASSKQFVALGEIRALVCRAHDHCGRVPPGSVRAWGIDARSRWL